MIMAACNVTLHAAIIIDEPEAALPDADRKIHRGEFCVIDLEKCGISTGRLEAASCNATRYRGSCGE
jgi:hypothetical protein